MQFARFSGIGIEAESFADGIRKAVRQDSEVNCLKWSEAPPRKQGS